MTPINGQRLFYIGPDEIWMGEDLESCQIARGKTQDHDNPVELTDEIVKATISHRVHLAFDTIAECAEYEINDGATTPMLLLSDIRRRDLERAAGHELPRSPVNQGQIIDRLLAVIGTICTSDCITDVIWLADQNGSTDQNVTVCEEIADIAHELGATDPQIDAAFNWQYPICAGCDCREGQCKCANCTEHKAATAEERDPNEVPF